MNSRFLSEFRPSRNRCLFVNCCSKTTPKRSGNLPNLEPWQKDRLESAFIEGKRKTKITQLSNELKLTRSEVLTWFKDFEAIPEEFVKWTVFEFCLFSVRSSILESLEERKKSDMELQEHIEGVRLSKQQRKVSRARHKRVFEITSFHVLHDVALRYERGRGTSLETIKSS